MWTEQYRSLLSSARIIPILRFQSENHTMNDKTGACRRPHSLRGGLFYTPSLLTTPPCAGAVPLYVPVQGVKNFCRMPESIEIPTVDLTIMNGESGRVAGVVAMKISRLLSYEQHLGYTRLRLTAGWFFDVREGTDEIDRRVRLAVSNHNLALRSIR